MLLTQITGTSLGEAPVRRQATAQKRRKTPTGLNRDHRIKGIYNVARVFIRKPLCRTVPKLNDWRE